MSMSENEDLQNKSAKTVGRKKARGLDNAITVAGFLLRQVEITEKTQRQIAEEAGFDNPNIISIFKKGGTKVPVNRVPQLANALNVDPIYFLSLVMSEYMPDTWNTIKDVLGKDLISKSEYEIIKVVREASKGIDVHPISGNERAELAQLVDKWVKREEADYLLAKSVKGE